MVRTSRPRTFWVLLVLAGPFSGCALVPKTRLDDCAKLSRSLQAETAQLKDSLVALRAQNRDYAQRAEADLSRIRALEDANQRFERIVLDYQQEREQLVSSYSQLRDQLRAAADSAPTALLDRLQEFGRSHPDCDVDPGASLVTLPSEALFETSSDRLRPEAETLLNDLARSLSGPGASDAALTIVGHENTPPVRLTGGPPPDNTSIRLDRAARLRDWLGTHGPISPTRIAVSDLGSQTPARGVEIRVRRQGSPRD